MSAVGLGVREKLGAGGPLTGEDRHNRLGLNKRGAVGFLDARVALGLLNRNDDGHNAIAVRNSVGATAIVRFVR